MSRVPPAVMAVVESRSAEHCEACAWPALVRVVHHRRAYGMGGREADDPRQNLASNLLYVHTDCHRRIHGKPVRAELRGFIVRDPTDPAVVPVLPDPRLSRW